VPRRALSQTSSRVQSRHEPVAIGILVNAIYPGLTSCVEHEKRVLFLCCHLRAFCYVARDLR